MIDKEERYVTASANLGHITEYYITLCSTVMSCSVVAWVYYVCSAIYQLRSLQIHHYPLQNTTLHYIL